MIQLEISKDDDKALVASILVMNGYTVKKEKIIINGRGKFVLKAWKDEKVEK